MKKVVSLILALVMCLSLCACKRESELDRKLREAQEASRHWEEETQRLSDYTEGLEKAFGKYKEAADNLERLK